jgi:hypothetical protein
MSLFPPKISSDRDRWHPIPLTTRPNMSPPKVLIVCLGNICRSPIGEAVLRHIAKERKIDLTVDSAGTAAYHVGEEPDDRSVYDPPRVFTRH